LLRLQSDGARALLCEGEGRQCRCCCCGVREGERCHGSRQTMALVQQLSCEGRGGGTGVAVAGVREGHGRRWGGAASCHHWRVQVGWRCCDAGEVMCSYRATSGAVPLRRHNAAWRTLLRGHVTAA
jgi:hypothetical protein